MPGCGRESAKAETTNDTKVHEGRLRGLLCSVVRFLLHIGFGFLARSSTWMIHEGCIGPSAGKGRPPQDDKANLKPLNWSVR